MKLPCYLLALFAFGATAAEPPKLIGTSPQFWAIGINPTSQKKIALTFDQPMIPAFTDWIGVSSVSPTLDLNSSITSGDRKTFELTVQLEPAKVYVFALNEKGIPGVGFQNDKGVSAKPTYLVFRTLGNPTPQNAPPVLVRAMPLDGMRDIDPTKVHAITLVFDQQMNVKKHGLQLSENGAIVNISRFQFNYSPDGRTFTLGYTFKQNAQYQLQLNSLTNIGFASVNRIPLWPLQISFTTSIPR